MYGSGWNSWDYGYESTRYTSSWTGSRLSDDYDDEASLVNHTPTFSECLEIAELYTDPIDATHNKVTCYLCESQEIVPVDEIRTHCGICSACLFCQYDTCNCWDALWEEPEMPTTNYGFEIPSGTNTHPSYY
jgi:hypothetical protein